MTSTQPHMEAAATTRDDGYYLSLTNEKPLPASSLDAAQGLLDYGRAAADAILGEACPAVETAVEELRRGGMRSAECANLLFDVASALEATIPCAESVWLLESGGAAVDGAWQTARAFTGRRLIVVATSPSGDPAPAAGADREEAPAPTFAFNRIEQLDAIFGRFPEDVAAVVIEPAGVVAPAPGFLQAVKASAHRHGALLVFDETVTGFRFAADGAQGYFGVRPDAAILGPSLGNGYAIGALVGRSDVMRAGAASCARAANALSPLSTAAARATLAKVTAKPVAHHLWQQGARLRDGLNALARHYGLGDVVTSHGCGPINRIVVGGRKGADGKQLEARFSSACAQRGLLHTPLQFVRFSHTQDDVDTTLRIYRAALELLGPALGRPPHGALRESA